jgi:hypothetical protein
MDLRAFSILGVVVLMDGLGISLLSYVLVGEVL